MFFLSPNQGVVDYCIIIDKPKFRDNFGRGAQAEVLGGGVIKIFDF